MKDVKMLEDAFRGQIAACRQLGSPFTAAVLEVLLSDMAAGGPTAEMVADWPGNPASDAVALRLAGALHALVLRHAAPTLAACYPAKDRDGSTEALPAAIGGVLVEHGPYIRGFIDQPPQTNEPMRSAVLLGGFLMIAAELGLPLRLFEIGASAGLNQIWDRYFYRLGQNSFGPESSPVTLTADWVGGFPKGGGMPPVASRAACDQAPIDLRDAEQRLRLRSYVWADQHARLARLEGAIELALADGVQVERADAGDWLANHLSGTSPGLATVVYHSVMWQYLPPETQHRVIGLFETAGQRASADAPLAWLRFEPRPAVDAFELRLTLWRGGTGQERLLARAHPHGAKIDWLAH